MNPGLSVLVTPRDSVPYQELLYENVRALGVRVDYDDGPTPSQTLNVVLAPALLVWRRIRGYQILHIHWVFQFSLPWARHARWAQWLMQLWFGVYLRTAKLVGYRVIWTAHDLLPHEPVFANDVRARALLLKTASTVIALSEATARELRDLGARQVDVIPHGHFESPYPVTLSTEEARTSFGFSSDDVVVTNIGRIERYKGADLLLMAAAQLPTTSKIKIVLAGSCLDKGLREELARLSNEAPARVTAVLEWLPEEDVARYLQAANFAAFPFREITNSGSVILAQSFGLPVLISNLSALSDIPDEAALRFDPNVESLLAALLEAEGMSDQRCHEMGDVGRAWAVRSDWSDIARETVETYRAACQRDK